ncbi:MAG: Glycosyltransferase [Candidatus Woesearchaeota archaeon]|nr:Glycosyltransferase [Candidatus Woesearchaeota archaeon]
MKVQIFSNDPIMNISIVFFFILFLFILFLFISYFLSLFKKKQFKQLKEPVSIIIPMFNEEKRIKNCLNSIIHSGFPVKLMQIMLIDDGSTDSSQKIVNEFIKSRKDINVSLIKQEHKGKVQALNKGVSNAKHDLIVTIDADTIIKPGAISSMISPLSRKDIGATNGVSLVLNPKTILEIFQSVEYKLNSLIRISLTRLFDNGIWFFGAAAAYKKKVLQQIGGFSSQTLTEDMDISLKLYNAGYKIYTAENAICFSDSPRTLKKLFAQRTRWWFGVLSALVKNRNSLKKANPSIWFLYVNQFWWTFYSFFSIPLFIYQIAYWWPGSVWSSTIYLFRWFSLLGPIYVIYKIPVWGLSFLNIFGVVSGLMSTTLILISIYNFSEKVKFNELVAIFFYFPYTIIGNCIIASSMFKYNLESKFIDKIVNPRNNSKK